jgi:hypothetical protein
MPAADQEQADHRRLAVRRLVGSELARGIEITDDLDTEPVLLERHDGRLQRVFIRQRGKSVSYCHQGERRSPGSGDFADMSLADRRIIWIR